MELSKPEIAPGMGRRELRKQLLLYFSVFALSYTWNGSFMIYTESLLDANPLAELANVNISVHKFLKVYDEAYELGKGPLLSSTPTHTRALKAAPTTTHVNVHERCTTRADISRYISATCTSGMIRPQGLLYTLSV